MIKIQTRVANRLVYNVNWLVQLTDLISWIQYYVQLVLSLLEVHVPITIPCCLVTWGGTAVKQLAAGKTTRSFKLLSWLVYIPDSNMLLTEYRRKCCSFKFNEAVFRVYLLASDTTFKQLIVVNRSSRY